MRVAAQHFFHRAALRVRAIEHGDVVQPQRRRRRAPRHHFADDELGFVALVERPHDGDASPRRVRRAQRLAHALRVRADHDVGQLENLRRRAIVLLEAHDRGVGKVLVEVEDVPNVGAAPAVDRLIVVADDAHVAVAAAEQLDQLVLRAIRVLILVDEDVPKALTILRELVGMVLQHPHGQHEQIVEVDGVRRCSASPSER